MKKGLLALASLAMLQFVSYSVAADVRLNDINFGYTHTIKNNTAVPVDVKMRLIGWHTQVGKKPLQPGETGTFQTGGWAPSAVIINTTGREGENREGHAYLGAAKEWNITVNEDSKTGRIIVDRQ